MKCKNVEPRFVLLPDAMTNNVVKPTKFMERVLPGSIELEMNMKSPSPNLLRLDATKSMFEGPFGERKAISTLCRDVD